MPHTRPLRPDDFSELHRAFSRAFSDYVVPFRQSPEQLRELLTRRGWVPELSVGVFLDGEMVAFTLNALDRWHGELTAYDSGTGVVPEHRRAGYGRRTMEVSISLVRAAGAERYLLEVLESNIPAVRLYRSLGFETARLLQCWRYDGGLLSAGVRPASSRDGQAYRLSPGTLAVRDWEELGSWFEIRPSWQNDRPSIERSGAERICIRAYESGKTAGLALVDPESGDLPLLTVAPQSRRRGVGAGLLRAAAGEISGGFLRILNIDASSEPIAAFLESAGAEPTVAQLEMALISS